MSTAGPASWIELANRAADGLEVVLLWNRASNRVKVAVIDERLCHHLDFEVAGTDALSAFYHSFACATSRLTPGASSAAIASRPIAKGEER
jgi:hypothetical protein